eukprot:CAMPEP_0113949348 /NCGR_PEP_ID=MMETSP1339-20121228/75299_1 /TAXON_ID=94617 /ORGANISM="Fibrocapsa japonica" /LENGTH=67 /DNA_ID=CAMNT_0000956763 /DNA_START=189 /DNA_END=392 /DNA_ORIENTATION=+ /assembly_acc=CAM_ASM_000762
MARGLVEGTGGDSLPVPLELVPYCEDEDAAAAPLLKDSLAELLELMRIICTCSGGTPLLSSCMCMLV